jgi:hypothetical protein
MAADLSGRSIGNAEDEIRRLMIAAGATATSHRVGDVLT